MRSKRIFFSKKSFTLLELMITSAILLIAIAGLLSVYVNALLLDETNRETVIAANDAQYVLEQVKGTAFADIEDYHSPALNNLQNENIPDPTVNSIGSNGRVKEVRVTVNWTGKRGRARSFSLTTRIFGEG